MPRRRSRAARPGPSSAAEPTGLPCASRRAPQAVGGQLCRWQVGAKSDRAAARVRCGVEGVGTVRGAQASASWQSGGSSQRQTVPPAARTLGQPAARSRAGRPYSLVLDRCAACRVRGRMCRAAAAPPVVPRYAVRTEHPGLVRVRCTYRCAAAALSLRYLSLRYVRYAGGWYSTEAPGRTGQRSCATRTRSSLPASLSRPPDAVTLQSAAEAGMTRASRRSIGSAMLSAAGIFSSPRGVLNDLAKFVRLADMTSP